MSEETKRDCSWSGRIDRASSCSEFSLSIELPCDIEDFEGSGASTATSI